MRYAFWTLAALTGFVLASCGNSSSGSHADMSAGRLSCTGVGSCVYDCLVANQSADVLACYSVCAQQAKPGSAAKWASAFNCGLDYCDPPRGDMLGKCVRVDIPAGKPGYIPPGQPGYPAQILCDAGQTYEECEKATSGVCLSCLHNAHDLLYADFSDPDQPGPPNFTCPDPNSPDCKGGAMCMGSFNSCLGDM